VTEWPPAVRRPLLYPLRQGWAALVGLTLGAYEEATDERGEPAMRETAHGWVVVSRVLALCPLVGALLVAPPTSAAATPGGNGLIAFESERDGGEGQVYVMEPDGARERNITNAPKFTDELPSWSPDGTHLTFRRWGEGICATRADGSHDVCVEEQGDLAGMRLEGTTSSWSPDGTHIAFEVFESADVTEHDIYVMDTDGANAVQLTPDHDGASYGTPAWSPDGRHIAFSRFIEPVGWHIYVMDPDGSDPVDLTSGWGPSWSPDGSKIAFADYGPEAEDLSVWVINVDGTGRTAFTEGPPIALAPAWSPDGTKIAFEGTWESGLPFPYIPKDSDIYLMDADGTDVGRLTDAPGVDRSPAWQPTCTLGTPGDDVLVGTAADECIFGYGGDDSISGGGGRDLLVGGGGSDTFAPGDGEDVVFGGKGSDVVSYEGSPSAVSVVLGGSTSGGYATGDTLASIEGLIGSEHDDVLTGDRFSNTFHGGPGDDRLAGLGGDDTLVGGEGTDTTDYSAATAGVTVDLSVRSAQATGGAGSDTLAGIEDVTGSAFGDVVSGTGGPNVLDGAAGDDTLAGLGGNDTLRGSGGDDSLLGDEGDDSLDGGDGTDSLDGGDGTDTCLNGEDNANCEE
jgi:Tol biopolymer transport system component